MLKVSIIIPVYNVKKYLKKCVYSVINQTYQNIEIILVDDGSNDGCAELCDNYPTIDNRIKVVHKMNEGLGFARNTGLEYVTGEYVTFVDSDDYVDENMIQLMVDTVEKYEVDTCIGGFKRVDDCGREIFKETYLEKVYNGEEVDDELFARMLGSSPDEHDAIRMSVWNSLYSMNIIRNNNVKFPSERVLISEDIVWDLEYYKYSTKVKINNDCSYNYRVTPGSLTQKYRENMLCKVNYLYQYILGLVDSDEKRNRLTRQYFVNIRSCIRQEKIKNMSLLEMEKAIELIVLDEVLKGAIDRYPVGRLHYKQKVFIKLIYHKCAFILALLVKVGAL